MRGVYGKAILFLDTCHANQAVAGARGPVDVNSVVNELAKTENGLIVFSSSQGRELSGESAKFSHGDFTEALIEGVDLGKRICCTRASSRSLASTLGSPTASSNSPKATSTPS